MFAPRRNFNRMAAASRVLEMMLGMTSSGVGHYDNLIDQIVWVDDGYQAQSDIDESFWKREDVESDHEERGVLPTLLTKRCSDQVLPRIAQKKAKIDAAVGDGIILPCDARMWCRKVFPFHVQHRLRSWHVGVGIAFVMRLLSMVIFVFGVCLNGTTRNGGHLSSQI